MERKDIPEEQRPTENLTMDDLRTSIKLWDEDFVLVEDDLLETE
jgi:hypothetical protein